MIKKAILDKISTFCRYLFSLYIKLIKKENRGGKVCGKCLITTTVANLVIIVVHAVILHLHLL